MALAWARVDAAEDTLGCIDMARMLGAWVVLVFAIMQIIAAALLVFSPSGGWINPWGSFALFALLSVAPAAVLFVLAHWFKSFSVPVLTQGFYMLGALIFWVSLGVPGHMAGAPAFLALAVQYAGLVAALLKIRRNAT